MIVTCLNCENKFELINASCDELGWHTTCHACKNSFDVDLIEPSNDANIKCYYCEDCGNKAIYDLKTGENEIIHVCEKCDDDYRLCGICGYAKPYEILSFLSEHDNQKTCNDCWDIGVENLQKKVNDKISADYKIYKKDAISESKESLFNNSYKNAVAGEWLFFFENSYEDNYDTEIEILDWLLSLLNIFEVLTNNTVRKDGVEFTSSGFCDMFEWFSETKIS